MCNKLCSPSLKLFISTTVMLYVWKEWTTWIHTYHHHWNRNHFWTTLSCSRQVAVSKKCGKTSLIDTLCNYTAKQMQMGFLKSHYVSSMYKRRVGGNLGEICFSLQSMVVGLCHSEKLESGAVFALGCFTSVNLQNYIQIISRIYIKIINTAPVLYRAVPYNLSFSGLLMETYWDEAQIISLCQTLVKERRRGRGFGTSLRPGYTPSTVWHPSPTGIYITARCPVWDSLLRHSPRGDTDVIPPSWKSKWQRRTPCMLIMLSLFWRQRGELGADI